jgi:very-short-patch-repair endonuclease
MTEAEAVLWTALRRRALGCRFRRQVPIGPYIVDFLCAEHHYVVECDGSQHLESRYDQRRDEYLARRGYTVVRFRNHEVLGELDMVLGTIALHRSEE